MSRKRKKQRNVQRARMCAQPSCGRITLRDRCDKCTAAEAHRTVAMLLGGRPHRSG